MEILADWINLVIFGHLKKQKQLKPYIMITLQDKELLKEKGISEEKIAEQLAAFEKGFPYLKLYAAASAEQGILQPDADEQQKYLDSWDAYMETGKKVVKFVPASGAASRMFKNLFEFVDASYEEPQTDFEKTFFANLDKFAFYQELDAACRKTTGKTAQELQEAKRYKDIVRNLLLPEGMNYGALPKGLLTFHKYEAGNRTPVEEHLVEGALYAAGKDGDVNVHFTVSPEHRALFQKLVDERAAYYAEHYGVNYVVSFSDQKASTDTLAVDMENRPFRDGGHLLFRPGGHGALIENLNDLDADVVFIKNIDNVVPDKLKGETVLYKKIIAGSYALILEDIEVVPTIYKKDNYEYWRFLSTILKNKQYSAYLDEYQAKDAIGLDKVVGIKVPEVPFIDIERKLQIDKKEIKKYLIER